MAQREVVLTSNDPTYKEKLARIRSILSNLQPDEAFFFRLTILERAMAEEFGATDTAEALAA